MMNRGVMQRQMFSNGGESSQSGNLRFPVEEQQRMQKMLPPSNFVGRKSQEVQNRMAQEELRKQMIIMEIERLMGGLPIVEKEALLKQPNFVLEDALAQVREKYGGPDESSGPRNLRFPVEEQRRMEELLPQGFRQMGRRDPNMTEQMGINAPMNRMEMLKNQQQVSAGRATPAPSSDMSRDFQGDVNMTQGNIDRELGDRSDLETLQRMRRYQGMAGGGEAVPNQYKGFSKLPENVQQKMNPALAKRYQQGGIASMMDPASMPQGNPMAGGQMDPAQMAMMEAEQAGRAQGEQIGAMVGEQTMMGLDQADDFKGAIDAIRGNNAPLEARYQELSEYVGPQDAMQTPESVLAMVQPTIMMTEEGAVDSGIGQLMQQITGNTAMETPDGQPTAMAEGVGSLMGVGQQPAEKKLLADGGAVQSFSEGTEVKKPVLSYKGITGETDFAKNKALFDSIRATPQARRDALQSDILFSLADRGLAFAGGIDPRTGESMAGAPILSQLGRAGAGLGATIGERLAAERAQDQASDQAALARTLSERDLQKAQDFQVGMKEKDQAFELVKMAEQFKYTKLTNEDQFSYNVRLAEQSGRLSRQLARLQGVIGSDLFKEKAALERELNKANNTLKREMQKDKFDQQTLLQDDDQTFKEAAQNRERLNSIALASINQRLKLGADKELENFRDQLLKENNLIKQGYEVINQNAEFQQQIKMEGIENTNEVARLDSAQGFTLKTMRIENRYKKERDLSERAFTASQAAINRLFERNERVYAQNFESELRKTLQANGFEQDEIDRQIKKRQQIFENIIAEEGLELEKAKQLVDEFYKTETIAINRLEANTAASKVGKPSSYITQKAIVVDGQEIPAQSFVELTDVQVSNLKDPEALRAPRNAQIETVKLSDGTTETVTIVAGLAYDANNNQINLGSGKYEGSLILGKETAYTSALDAQERNANEQELRLLQQGVNARVVADQVSKGVTRKDGSTFIEGSDRQAALVVNMVDKIMKGTGPYSNLKVAFNKAMSLTPDSWGWNQIFLKEVDAQNWITVLNVTGRVALSSSPRLAEAEQARLGALVPSTEEFFANPRAALAKTMVLKRELKIELEANLDTLRSTSDKMLKREAKRQNASIKTFLALLQDVPEYGYISDEKMDELKERIKLGGG